MVQFSPRLAVDGKKPVRTTFFEAVEPIFTDNETAVIKTTPYKYGINAPKKILMELSVQLALAFACIILLLLACLIFCCWKKRRHHRLLRQWKNDHVS